MPKLSVTIITKNEAADIGAALASVAWADEIVVVDSDSTDDTVAIARQYTERVVVREWPGYIEQKNYAASLASHDWILSLDADERVTPELAAEIQTLMAAAPRDAAFRMPRVTLHLGRWIRTTDWYPDYQLRLYDRRAARWTGRYVHEAVDRRAGRSGCCAASCSTSPTATSPITSRPSTAIRRTPRVRCTRTAGAPGSSR